MSNEIENNEASEAGPRRQSDPLHGVKLEAVLTRLVAKYGWDGLGARINIRCFTSNPGISSSLKFLRSTPWARKEVETLYVRTFPLQEDRKP